MIKRIFKALEVLTFFGISLVSLYMVNNFQGASLGTVENNF